MENVLVFSVMAAMIIIFSSGFCLTYILYRKEKEKNDINNTTPEEAEAFAQITERLKDELVLEDPFLLTLLKQKKNASNALKYLDLAAERIKKQKEKESIIESRFKIFCDYFTEERILTELVPVLEIKKLSYDNLKVILFFVFNAIWEYQTHSKSTPPAPFKISFIFETKSMLKEIDKISVYVLQRVKELFTIDDERLKFLSPSENELKLINISLNEELMRQMITFLIINEKDSSSHLSIINHKLSTRYPFNLIY
jgi:hypothetical protein